MLNAICKLIWQIRHAMQHLEITGNCQRTMLCFHHFTNVNTCGYLLHAGKQNWLHLSKVSFLAVFFRFALKKTSERQAKSICSCHFFSSFLWFTFSGFLSLTHGVCNLRNCIFVALSKAFFTAREVSLVICLPLIFLCRKVKCVTVTMGKVPSPHMTSIILSFPAVEEAVNHNYCTWKVCRHTQREIIPPSCVNKRVERSWARKSWTRLLQEDKEHS